MTGELTVRAARAGDADAIWRVLEPMIRDGETYPFPRDMSREAALDYWRKPEHEVFVAEDADGIHGTYFLRANGIAGVAHVANCGYVTGPWSWGKGIARAMCAHSFARARERGFRAMQYNFVVASNTRAVQLWKDFGMQIVGVVPDAFLHPTLGYVNALVMYRAL
jgi:ribosomal protein S18 acetylase RimI-like enzyme